MLSFLLGLHRIKVERGGGLVRNSAIFVCILAFSELLGAQERSSSVTSCVHTAAMRIYSNAFAHEETGDLLGYELAIKQNKDSTADILLYVYEGAPDDEGIPLSGHISRKHLTVHGDWFEHLVEYPSEKKIVQTHSVKIDGTLDATSFRGEIRIDDLNSPDSIRLKRVKKLWFCK